jgi:hypothetical protein
MAFEGSVRIQRLAIPAQKACASSKSLSSKSTESRGAHLCFSSVSLILKHASASFFPWTVIRQMSAPLSAIRMTCKGRGPHFKGHFWQQNVPSSPLPRSYHFSKETPGFRINLFHQKEGAAKDSVQCSHFLLHLIASCPSIA